MSFENSPTAKQVASRTKFLRALDATLAAVYQLEAIPRTAFPDVAAIVDQRLKAYLTEAQRMPKGKQTSGERAELAFNLDAALAIDRLELALPADTASSANTAIGKAQ